MQNHSNENDFDLHENGRAGETHFHMNRAATIHWCTAIFFVTIRISIFEWDIAVSQNNKIFLIKNEKLLYQHSEITVLISFMTPYPSTGLFLPQGFVVA